MLQPRAIGAAQIGVCGDAVGQTRLVNLRQSGALRLVLPTTYRRDTEAIIVNTAGGITGGDRFDIAANAAKGATLTLSTQAAERIYRAQPGEVAHVTTSLRVEAGARLNWLPQETILFDHSALHRRLRIDLAKDAQVLMVESLVFGRAAMQERLNDITLRDRVAITRDGYPIYVDGVDLTGDATAHLARPAIAQGAGAMASLVFAAPRAAACLATIRDMLPASAGASMIAENVLVLRLLAPDSYDLRRALVPVLDLLTNNTLPTSWRL